MKEINIVYPPHQGEDVFRFKNENGIVHMSSQRRPEKINVFINSTLSSEPGDSTLILEPVVVNACDYNFENLKRFRKIFGFAEQAYSTNDEIKNKLVKINYPSTLYKRDCGELKEFIKPFDHRTTKVCIVANNHPATHEASIYSLRVALADFLYNNGIDIKWYGAFPLKKPYYKGPIKSKFEALSNAKFTICSENTYHPIYSENYLTEKMPDAWMSAAVPIYMGCYNIDDFKLPPNMYIDLRKYVKIKNKDNFIIDPELINVILGYNQKKYNDYISALVSNMQSENSFANLINYENVFAKMIEVL